MDKFYANFNLLLAFFYRGIRHPGEKAIVEETCDWAERTISLIVERQADLGEQLSVDLSANCIVRLQSRERARLLYMLCDGFTGCTMKDECVRKKVFFYWTPHEVAEFLFPELRDTLRTPFDTFYKKVDKMLECPSYKNAGRYCFIIRRAIRFLIKHVPEIVSQQIVADEQNCCLCRTMPDTASAKPTVYTIYNSPMNTLVGSINGVLSTTINSSADIADFLCPELSVRLDGND